MHFYNGVRLSVLIVFLLLCSGRAAEAVRVSLILPHQEVILVNSLGKRPPEWSYCVHTRHLAVISGPMSPTGFLLAQPLLLAIEYPVKSILGLDGIDYRTGMDMILKDYQDRIGQLEKSKKKKRKYSYEKDFLQLKPRIGSLYLGRDWNLAHSVKTRLDRLRDLHLVLDSFNYWNGVRVFQNPALLKTKVRSLNLFVVQTIDRRGWRHFFSLGGGLSEIGLDYNVTALKKLYKNMHTVTTYGMMWKAVRITAGNEYLAFEIRVRKGDRRVTVDSIAKSVGIDFNNTYYGVGYNFFFPIFRYLEDRLEEGSRSLKKLPEMIF
ncbi:MAG: hypothetical protein QGH40_07075 [bacterium]|nr:hypothetical protein [bacterium]